MFSWYKYLIVNLFFFHLGFWSGNLFLIAPFPDLCLLVPFCIPFFQRGTFVDLNADDTTMYEQHFGMKTVQSNQQKFLNSLHDLYRTNGMVLNTLNTLKTKVLLITSRHK